MKIFAIGDTHLSGNPPNKPMDIFGEHWKDHWSKIKESWQSAVSDADCVLLAGDISWAMKLTDALPDLEEIAELPGKKILIRGNHDYWWDTLTKMQKATAHRFCFLQNNFHPAGEFAVCGSRGWICPDDPAFAASDVSIYERELLRIRASLTAAEQAGFQRQILLLHYPPIFGGRYPNRLTELAKEFHVEICVYGHIHDAVSQKTAPAGFIDGIFYHLAACDALGFQVKQIV